MKKKLIAIILICFAVLAVGFGFKAWQCSSVLLVEHYTVAAPLLEPVRIVQLSDLHSWTFGEGNAELVIRVKALEPDLIVMTGDMLDKSDEGAAVVCDLIRSLAGMASFY